MSANKQDEIFEAANRLAAEGKKPTSHAIRELLGSGSLSTISTHLKSWREQTPVLEQPLDPVREAFAKLLAPHLERVALVEAEAAESVAEIGVLEDQVEKLTGELAGLKSELDQLRGEFRATKTAAADQAAQFKTREADLVAQLGAAQVEAAAAKARLEERVAVTQEFRKPIQQDLLGQIEPDPIKTK